MKTSGEKTKKAKRIDVLSFLTLALTVVLFVAALFEKGLTHDMLLEAGVFLVSMKLVLSSYKHSEDMKAIAAKLDRLMDSKGR